MTTPTPIQGHHDVVIIGAGFGGLGLGIRLKQEGRNDFIIVEQEVGVGGTWHANRYPGAACDIPSLLYSFSFAPTANWTRSYPGQEEIEQYLNHCVAHFELEPHLKLRTKVLSLDWDATTQRWTVLAQQRGGSEVRWTARVVIGATGALSRPVTPDIPGIEDFQGPVMHTARWQGEVNLSDRRVGIVGTGASAIQIVPKLVDRAAQVVLFQRTPPWILPKHDRVRPAWRRWLYANVPGMQTLARGIVYAMHEARAPAFIRWTGLLKAGEQQARRFMEKQVHDPALREALTPNYRMGCKRILIASDFYPAIQRRNAKLVTSSIDKVVGDGVITADGQHHPLDVLVLATGFQAAAALAPFPIRGRNGLELNEAWRDGAKAYLGTTVPGFPNFFMLVGPNTTLGHNSMVYMIESQIRYVLDALDRMDAAHLAAVDTRADVSEAYNAQIQERLQRTIWVTGGCTSWYRVGDRRISTLWPHSTLAFRWHTRRFRLDDHEPLRA
jgi:cation diffusion facilitator CzcD-associated flavoprotein CzcO